MHQTLNFLTIIDDRIKRNHHYPHQSKKLNVISTRERVLNKKGHRYPYAKAIDFRESKYHDFPKWLIQKEGFSDFMYKSYEKKLMSIPKICQKENRESDEKYFLSQYLDEVPLFKNAPHQIHELIIDNIKTRYYKPGQVVHEEQNIPEFLGLIYIGEVEYKSGKRMVSRTKNDIILIDAFQGRKHATITCKQETIILTLQRSIWALINGTMKKQIDTKERDQLSNMFNSRFFTQLHMKDKRAQQFYQHFDVQCYFPGQIIQEAGSEEKIFYIIFRGKLAEDNHIYIREHNKWPLPNRRWEVRAVYNSYNQSKYLKKFAFFGDEEILENLKFKASYTATQWTILLKMHQPQFQKNLNQEDVKRLKKYRAQHSEVNYGDFETQVRTRAKSTSDRKKIVLKAINTSLNHKLQFSPKRMALIGNYEKQMLKRALFEEKQPSSGPERSNV